MSKRPRVIAMMFAAMIGLACSTCAPVPDTAGPLPNLGTVVPFTATPTQTPLDTSATYILHNGTTAIASTPAPDQSTHANPSPAKPAP